MTNITLTRIVYWISYLIFIVSALFAGYIFLFSILGLLEWFDVYNFPLVDVMSNAENSSKSQIAITIPFTSNFSTLSTSYGWYSLPLIVISLSATAVYFYYLKEFFKTFIHQDIFQDNSIKKIRTLLFFNILLTLVNFANLLYECILLKRVDFSEQFFYFLTHLSISLLLYLYLDILIKGSDIRKENDLTI